MRGICKWIVRIFVVLYLIALAIGLIGTYGLFGQEKDPLGWVFVIPLGLPWIRFGGSLPEAWLPWFGAVAPIVNIVILTVLCRIASGNRK